MNEYTEEEAKRKVCPYKYCKNEPVLSFYCEVDDCMAWEWTETKRVCVGQKTVRASGGMYRAENDYEMKNIKGKCRAFK